MDRTTKARAKIWPSANIAQPVCRDADMRARPRRTCDIGARYQTGGCQAMVEGDICETVRGIWWMAAILGKAAVGCPQWLKTGFAYFDTK